MVSSTCRAWTWTWVCADDACAATTALVADAPAAARSAAASARAALASLPARSAACTAQHRDRCESKKDHCSPTQLLRFSMFVLQQVRLGISMTDW